MALRQRALRESFGKHGKITGQICIEGPQTGMDGFTARRQILSSKFDRIAAEPFGQFIDLRFARKRHLGRAESSEGTGRDGVGVNGVAVHLDVRNPVGSDNAVGCSPGDQWAILRISTRIEVDRCLQAHKPSLAIRGHANADARIVVACGEHGLLNAELQLDRPFGFPRACCRQRLDLGIGFAAVASADERHDQPHTIQR